MMRPWTHAAILLLPLQFSAPTRVAAQGKDAPPVVEAERIVVQGKALGDGTAGPASAAIDNGDGLLPASWDQVTSQVPNLGFEFAGANSFGAIFALRGLSNTPYFSDPAVTLYYDDIPLGGSFTYPTDLFGLSSALVYAGPQPTAFGRAGDGGVIVLLPSSAPAPGEVLAGVGSYNARSAAAEVGSPEGLHADGFAAAAYSQRDGYVMNTQIHQAVDDLRAFEAFARERIRPTAASELTIEILAGRHRDGAAPLVPLDGPLYTVERSREGATDTEFLGAALKGELDLDAARFTAVTSYTNWKLNPYDDWLVLPPPIQSSLTQSQIAWNEELRLTSVRNEPISWNIGSWLSFGTTAGAADRSIGGVIPFEVSDYGYTRHEAALFAGITLVPGPNWHVSIGGRLQQVGKVYHQDQQVPGPDLRLNFTRNDGAFLPNLTATYDLSALASFTASATGGARPGGFAAYTDNPSLVPFPAEHVAALEAGLQRSTANRLLVLSVRAFDYEIRNYQIERSFSPTDYFVATAPRASSLGAEARASWRPSAEWTVVLVVGRTEARLLAFNDPLTGHSYAGDRAPYAPAFTAALAIDYRSACGWFASGSFTASGKTYYTESENPTYAQGDYGIIDGRAGFDTRRWRISVYVQNAANKGYYSLIVPGVDSGAPGAPRTIGSEFSIKF